MTPPDTLPNWLLLIVMFVTTDPVLEIPVNPPDVAVDVLPLKMLLLIVNTSTVDELMMPTMVVLDEGDAVIAQLSMEFAVILIVPNPLKAFWLRMASKVPDVKALDMVMVLLLMLEVKPTVGAVAV